MPNPKIERQTVKETFNNVSSTAIATLLKLIPDSAITFLGQISHPNK